MDYEVDIEKRKCNAVWRKNIYCPMHVQRDLEIVVMTQGTLQMMIDGVQHTISAGQAIFVEPYEPHCFLLGASNVCCVIEFRPELAQNFFHLLQHHITDDRVLTLDARVFSYLEYLLPDQKMMSSDIDVVMNLEESYMQTIAHVLSYEFMTHCKFRYTEKKYDDIYIAALHIISRDLDKRLTLAYVAKQLGICPETLCRKFTEHAHMSFTEYIQYVRVHRAATLLLEGMAISDAAMSAGFGSICSFNRVFRKIIGCTPSEYRKNNTVHRSKTVN